MPLPQSIENDLNIERGGPVYQFMTWIGLIRPGERSVRRRVIALIGITILPLVVLAWYEGVLIGPTPRQSLLYDFAFFTRFVVAIPLLMVAELSIGQRVAAAGLHFVRAGLVDANDHPAFERAVRRLARWRDSWSVELSIVGIALIGAWTLTAETVHGVVSNIWYSVMIESDSGTRLSLVGLWYRIVAVPLLQFFWYRWIWRCLVWARFLLDVSRMRLNLVPNHADAAGGLGFLGTAHTSFAILSFAMCSVLSAAAGFLIVFEDVPITEVRIQFVVLLVLAEILILGPLLMFCPAMIRARQRGLRDYSLLVLKYNRAFHDKWVEGQAPPGESLLGSADIQSLADLGNSFEFIRAMKLVPFSIRVMLQIGVVTLLPALPLLLLVMPIEEVIGILTRAVF